MKNEHSTESHAALLPTTAVAKDRTVHKVGCPALDGSPRCNCETPGQKSIACIDDSLARQGTPQA